MSLNENFYQLVHTDARTGKIIDATEPVPKTDLHVLARQMTERELLGRGDEDNFWGERDIRARIAVVPVAPAREVYDNLMVRLVGPMRT